MAKIKCRFCEAPVDEKAVICINCGTNLKTGKSLILNKPKKRRLFKLLMLILFLAFVIAGGFHFFRLYKQNSTTALLPKEDKFAGTTAPDSNRDLSGLKNITTFPVNVKKSKNADDYHISIRQGLKKIWKKQYSKEDENKFTVYMNIRVSPNKHDNGQLRLKIYQGDASSSQYSLVYDRIAEIKEHNDIPILKKIPDSYKKLPPNVQKRILSHYKRNYDRQMRIYQMRKKSTFQAAKFSYSANSIIIPKNNIYFRILLCHPDGRIIKEHAPYKLQVSQSYSNNVNRINNNYQVKHDINEDAIYPSLFFGKPILYFDFHQRQAFKIKAIWIDGVNYPVPYLSECTSLTQRDKKSGKPVSIFRNILRFDYPFGGNVTLKLKIKNKSGIFKTVYYKFYLPFPPPALRKRFLPEQNKIFIYWENNAKYLNPQNFSRLPELVLSQSNNEIKTFKSFKAGKYEVNNVSPGEPVSYTLSLKNG
jgi:hypothetical protein